MIMRSGRGLAAVHARLVNQGRYCTTTGRGCRGSMIKRRGTHLWPGSCNYRSRYGQRTRATMALDQHLGCCRSMRDLNWKPSTNFDNTRAVAKTVSRHRPLRCLSSECSRYTHRHIPNVRCSVLDGNTPSKKIFLQRARI